MLDPVAAYASLVRNPSYLTKLHLDILFAQSLKIVDSWSEAPAAETPFWNQLGSQVRSAAQFSLHLLGKDCLCFDLCI